MNFCRIYLYLQVSSLHASKGLSAKKWLEETLAAVGSGKGGGKDDVANGSLSGGSEIVSSLISTATLIGKSKIQ